MISLNGFYEYTGYWITMLDCYLLIQLMLVSFGYLHLLKRVRKLEDRIQRSQDEEP